MGSLKHPEKTRSVWRVDQDEVTIAICESEEDAKAFIEYYRSSDTQHLTIHQQALLKMESNFVRNGNH